MPPSSWLATTRPRTKLSARIDDDYFHAGLARLFVYCLGQEDVALPTEVSAVFSGRIELRQAADLPPWRTKAGSLMDSRNGYGTTDVPGME